ncbi:MULTISPECIES: hypothetical protein [unclassified Arthrobacter]|uniref:hypothetical protein n=1 Tax=unclassified Arthrobacter TaxID=235627 RepID=UPI002E056319|nr:MULTISPECIES: hypothetical protein [unclassified Arthrobacter]MEC5189833.1 hypothetical protein [Arthrobacter sp. MP_M4]MEC5201300.1 hypothetical protein [Arthrobacter sp. MP_M7]
MNEQTNGQLKPAAPGQDGSADRSASSGEGPRSTVDKAAGRKNEAILGPFTIRDVTVFGSTLILFVASLIPMFGVGYNLWNLGSLFFLGLGILLPVIVVALFVARRVSPGTRIRIGSLSVDQFGSVVASFAVGFFFLAVAGAYVSSMLLGLVGALGLFAATVLGRFIPVFAGDFLGRAEVPAHVVARESAVPVRKPRAPKAPAQAADGTPPKAAGPNAVAGWAKRMTSGGASTAGTGAGAAGAAAAPPAHGSTAQEPAPAPVVSSTEPRTSGAVPGASAPETPASGERTTAAVVPPAANAATGGEGPDVRARAAAEETRASGVPAASGSAPTTVNPRVRQEEPIGATVDPASRPEDLAGQPAHEAFWFAVAQPRTAMDERTGTPAFVVEPGGWVLALEDRGHEFLVQHTDGRVGVLRDLSNIERG